jgi:hypothetical protein
MAPERAAYSRMVYDFILASPGEHSQKHFGQVHPCGTKHCIAGWAVILDPDTDVTWFEGSGGRYMNTLVHVHDETIDISRRAADLLGLDQYSDHIFFEMDDSAALDMFRRWIEEAEAAA